MEEEAKTLAQHAAAFKHLKRIDFSENLLSGEGEKLLSKLCASVATGNQRENYNYSDDEDNRYVAVGE